MFSLIRSGPKILVVSTQNIITLKSWLAEVLNAVSYDIDTAFDKSTENDTILFLTDTQLEVIDEDQILNVCLIKEEADAVLCKLLNSGYSDLISHIRTAPRLLILRVIGNLDLVMKEIQSDMGGVLGSFMDLLDEGSQHSTLVSITEKPLNRSMRIGDLYHEALKLEGSYAKYAKELRMHALKYLNIGINNRDWHEIEIRIFDRYSAYELHYDRLVELFEALELGLVLGESWSKDYPRLFMAVEVYRVRFFTFFDPKIIKQYLLGMEYTQDGMRIVDYDVYYNHKKMDWTEVLKKEDPKNRLQAGKKYRDDLFLKLGTSAKEELLRLEEAVIKTRV